MTEETKQPILELYVNSAQLTMSPYELAVTWGIKRDPDQDPQALVVTRMSPEHAKALLRVLQSNIRAFEEQVGQIPLKQPEPAEAKK